MERNEAAGAPDGITLSGRTLELAQSLFRAMDRNQDMQIDREEALEWWRKSFAKINTATFFQNVDKDSSKGISYEEWLEFWEKVKRSGYSEEELQEELEELINKGSWVGYNLENN